MNLHEYQGKLLLKKYGGPVPEIRVIDDSSNARKAAREVQEKTGCTIWAVKAQIHAGGRGKGGGVKIAKSLDEVEKYASQILGMQLVTPQTGKEGKKVRKVLIEQGIYYKGKYDPAEFYFGILLNRATSRNIMMYSPRGGMDIEKVAEETPGQIYTEEIDPKTGIMPFQARRIAFNFGLKDEAFKNMVKCIPRLYDAYIQTDAKLLEINPLFKAADNKIIAADTKMVIDDNALSRQNDIEKMRDTFEEDPIEVEAGNHELNYIKLDGNVGCMVNGAGLAMATMDIIKLSGGAPANFLDVGGSANAERVEKAFKIIISDTNVKAVLVNIFGGIVRCDNVAKGIIEACKNIGELKVPVIIRLQGTNALEAKELIDNSGLEVYPVILLKDAAQLINKLIENT